MKNLKVGVNATSVLPFALSLFSLVIVFFHLERIPRRKLSLFPYQMPIEFACDRCTKMVRVPDGSEGKKCKCPQCQAVLTIPNEELPDVEIKLEVPCPRCQHVLLCDPSLEGTRGLCPSCKHIFTITTEASPDHASSSVLHLTFPFQCPHCQQLFEGKPGMEGRKGKCISCNNVFEIVRQESPKPDPDPVIPDKVELEPLEPVYKPTNVKAVPTLRRPIPVSPVTSSPAKPKVPTAVPVLPSQPTPVTTFETLPTPSMDWTNSISTPAAYANPYAAAKPHAKDPSSSYGSASSALVGSADSIRQKHLQHEAAIKGFGILYSISSVLMLILSMLLLFLIVMALSLGLESRRGTNSDFAVGTVVMGIVVAMFFAVSAFTVSVAVGLFKLSLYGRISGIVATIIYALGATFSLAINLITGVISLVDARTFANLRTSGILQLLLQLLSNSYSLAMCVYLLYLLISPKGSAIFSPKYRSVVKQTSSMSPGVPAFVWVTIALGVGMIVAAMCLVFMQKSGY